MERFKSYLLGNFEQLFILGVLVATTVINYTVPAKLAFLNFYFLPVILAAYYLDRRKAMLGAVLSVVYTLIYLVYSPHSFLTVSTETDLYLHFAAWAGFLLLTGGVLGSVQEKLRSEVESTRLLNDDLRRNEEELSRANVALRDYSEDLESRVARRTEELEQSKVAIESLKGKVEEALYRTMDPSVVNLMIEGRLRNEKRDMSVLFSDLVGFTAYSEKLPPEVVIGELNRYLDQMEPVLLTYHGHIDKYMGDAIMAEFGAPLDFDTHRLQAVLCGLKLQEKLAAGAFPWQMRIGIGSGTSIAGLIGSRRQSYTAIGDVVNLASRLETACRPGMIVIDRETYDSVRHLVDARPLRHLRGSDADTVEKENEARELRALLEENQDDVDACYRLGQLCLALGDTSESLEYIERAMQLDPTRTDLKVAFADARLGVGNGNAIRVRGRSQPTEAFEVLGLRDPLEDRNRIPASFYEKYAQAAELIRVPEDVILPVEALDGSVGHSRTVAMVAYALADSMRLPESEKTTIMQAGFLADIGKEVLPPHLLNRGGGLSQSEYEIVREHPVESVRILRKHGYQNERMLEIVLHSHEYYDGSGYPNGLRGEAIPLGSGIVCVADTYAALTAKRSYREAWDRHAALDEMGRNVDKGLYDPQVVGQLDRLMR